MQATDAGGMHRARALLCAPIDAAALALFRVLFSAIMLWEVCRLWPRLESLYLARPFHFKYDLFSFVTVWPGNGIYFLAAAIGFASAMLLLGVYYRAAALLFFLSFSYYYLLDQALYLNHFYLVCLLGLLLCVVKGNACWSLDSYVRGRSESVPYWHLMILRLQFVIVYFFGGVAKLNADWLAGEPVRHWIRDRARYSDYAWFLEQEWLPYFISWAGLAFDLCVGFALLHSRLRWWAMAPLLVFHLSNAYLFNIGIFPWLSLSAFVLFLDPDHPRRLAARLRRRAADEATPAPRKQAEPAQPAAAGPARCRLGFFYIFLAIQLLLPLRHLLFPGDVAWTEEGHKFSWRMKLRSKDGSLRLRITDRVSGKTTVISRFPELSSRQIEKMTTRPDMLYKYVQHLADRFEAQRRVRPQIQAENWVSLNGRPFQLLIDPEVDLARAEYSPFRHSTWLRPLPAGLPRGQYPRRPPSSRW